MEFDKKEPIKARLRMIRQFATACERLGDPENQIKARTGQYRERQVYTRTASDMKAEMAQKLASLPRYTAWVKLLDPFGEVIKSKIKTFNVADRFNVDENYIDTKRIILRKTREWCCTRRDRIEADINERQAQWKKAL